MKRVTAPKSESQASLFVDGDQRAMECLALKWRRVCQGPNVAKKAHICVKKSSKGKSQPLRRETEQVAYHSISLRKAFNSLQRQNILTRALDSMPSVQPLRIVSLQVIVIIIVKIFMASNTFRLPFIHQSTAHIHQAVAALQAHTRRGLMAPTTRTRTAIARVGQRPLTYGNTSRVACTLAARGIGRRRRWKAGAS